jgi:hypothetical protein
MRSIQTGRNAAFPIVRERVDCTTRPAVRAAAHLFAVASTALVATPVMAQDAAQTPFAQAQELFKTGQIAAASVSTLMILFVLAVLVESALAVIFNWRLFLEMFNGRGVKTLVAIIVSWVVVYTFRLDQQVFEALLTAYGLNLPAPDAATPPDRTIGIILTTLILAGGSGGVNRILVALGYREPVSDKPRVPKLPKGKAWVAIRVTRQDAVGPIEVHIQDKGPKSGETPLDLAGVITPTGFWYRLWSVFFLDRSRYPPTAGRDVLPGHVYAITVEARKQNGEVIECDLNKQPYSFADGAIIDFHVTL